MRWMLAVALVGIAIWLLVGGRDPEVLGPDSPEPSSPAGDAPELLEGPTLLPGPSVTPVATPTPEPTAPATEAPDSQALDFTIYGIVKRVGSDEIVSSGTVVGVRRSFEGGKMKMRRIQTEPDGPGRFKLHVARQEDVPTHWELTGKDWRVTKWERGDDPTKVYFDPIREKLPRYDVTLWAYEAFWIRGTVVDSDNRLVEGAEVAFAMPISAGTNLQLGSIRVQTDAEGRFEVGPFPDEPSRIHPALKDSPIRHMLDLKFSKVGFTKTVVDPYGIEPDQRERLEVVLSTGAVWSGTLVDRSGAPLPDVVVEMRYGDQYTLRRATRTDADGRWRLDRLSAGKATLLARAYDHDARARKDVVIDDSDQELRLVADPLDLETPAEIVDVFGLKLVNVDVKIRAAFDVPKWTNVMIWDAGENPDRLKIGTLRRGFGLWMVGDTDVKTVAHAIQLFYQANKSQSGPGAYVSTTRVVYNFWSETNTGSNTQHLSLGEDDLAQLTRLDAAYRSRYPKTPVK